MEIFIELQDGVLIRKTGLSISRARSLTQRLRKALIKSLLAESSSPTWQY
jgi:hypothetical protein